MDTVTFQGTPLHLMGKQPKVGTPAPDFTLTANDLTPRTLKDFAGKILVLACVPSLDTPVCDLEMRHFNAEAPKLSDKVRIVAVSRDLPFAQARWCGAANAKAVETLSDYKEGGFGLAYGVLIEELRLLARAVFVVGPDGILTYSQIVPEMTDEPDYAAVLNAVKALA